MSRMGGFKNLHLKNQKNLTTKEPNETPAKAATIVSELGEFSEDEISKLRSFLKTIQYGSCSLAQTGMCLNSKNFNASKTVGLSSWIVDSGATNHMTQDSTIFETYKPVSSNQKITVANGNSVSIAGQGDAKITTSLPLKNVLHVPKLSINLISFHQLTKDLNYRAIFSPHDCVF